MHDNDEGGHQYVHHKSRCVAGGVRELLEELCAPSIAVEHSVSGGPREKGEKEGQPSKVDG